MPSVHGMELAWICTHAMQIWEKILDATQSQDQFEKAVRKQDIPRIKYLLENKKIDINRSVGITPKLGAFRMPPLWYAFMSFRATYNCLEASNDLQMANLLVQHGAQVDAKSSQHFALLYFDKILHVFNTEDENPQSIEGLHFFLAHGANPLALGRHGELPLHLAAYSGNVQMAQALLNAPWYPPQSQERLTTFLCCLLRLKNEKKLPSVPKDMRKMLGHYIMVPALLPHLMQSLTTKTSKRIWVHQAGITISVNSTPLQIARKQQKKYPDKENYKMVIQLLEKAARFVKNKKQGVASWQSLIKSEKIEK